MVDGIQGERQVFVAREGAVRGAGDDLVQVNVVHEGAQGGADFPGGADFQRGTEVQLAELDVVPAELFQRGAGGFVLQGEVAGVVVHAEMRVQARVVGMFVAHRGEEGHGLGGVLEQPERFGFDAEMQRASGAFADADDVFDAGPEVPADGGEFGG